MHLTSGIPLKRFSCCVGDSYAHVIIEVLLLSGKEGDGETAVPVGVQHTLADDLAAALGHRVADVRGGQRMPRIALQRSFDLDAVPGEIKVGIRIEAQVECRENEVVDADAGGGQLPCAVKDGQAENATALLPLEEELPGGGAEFIGLQFAGADCLALGVEQLDS